MAKKRGTSLMDVPEGIFPSSKNDPNYCPSTYYFGWKVGGQGFGSLFEHGIKLEIPSEITPPLKIQ